MWGMFSDCSNLTNLDLSSFDSKNVTKIWIMFSGCSYFTNLDLSSFDKENDKLLIEKYAQLNSSF